MPLGMEVRLGPGHIVLDGDSAPLPKKGGRASQFSAHFYCGQTAGCIKMPLGTEVGLGLRDIVLDTDPAPRPLKAPKIWPNGWMDQDATWYRGKPRPRRRCVRWVVAPPERGTTPSFRFMSSQTAGWMKTPLGAEVDLGPRHIVLDGDLAPP